MTISSVSDLLALPWSHAYCAEGPGMVAEGYSNGDAVDRWPDEIGSNDLVQAVPDDQPSFVAASGDFNGQPSITSNAAAEGGWLVGAVSLNDPVPGDTTGFLLGAFSSSMGQAFEVVCIGRITDLSGGEREFWDNSTPGVGAVVRMAASSADYRMAHGTGGNLLAGTPDTNGHMLLGRFSWGGTDEFYLDGSLIASGSDIFNHALDGFKTGTADWELVFLGAAPFSGALTAGNRTDIHTFSASHWGTP